MPFSDNLYSVDDSDDGESFSDELSPVDGYFNRNDIPPNIMVPDPSLEANSNTEAKAQEARQEAQANQESQPGSTHSPLVSPSTLSDLYASAPSNPSPLASPPWRTLSSPLSPRHTCHNLYSERSPLLAAPAGPPPAYSPPAPATSSAQETQSGRSYSTFPQYQLEAGNPQSMGSPDDEPNEPSTLWMRHAQKWRHRAVIQNLLFSLLVLSVAMALLLSTLRSGHSSKSGDHPNIPPNEPSKSFIPGRSSSYCSYATYRDEETTFSFPMDTKLSIKQSHYNEDGDSHKKPVSTTGEIRIRPVPKDSQYPDRGYFTASIYKSDPKLMVKKDFHVRDHAVRILTPSFETLDTPGPHCVSVEITAWVPESSWFDSIDIQTIEVTQRVFEGTKLNVGLSRFKTITGGVHFPKVDESDPIWKSTKKNHRYGLEEAKDAHLPDLPSLPDLLDVPDAPDMPDSMGEFPSHNWSSRHITVTTSSGSITGGYPLYDFLGIESISGSVSVEISPQKIAPKAPAPAVLSIKTTASSIQVRSPIHGPVWMLPPREYITNVVSKSGSLQGSYITGSKGVWSSESGSIGLEVLPIIEISKDARHEFHTSSTSGSTEVELLGPIFIPKRSPSYLEEMPSDGLNSPPLSGRYKPVGDEDLYLMSPNLAVGVDNTKKSEQKLRSLVSSHTSKSGMIQLQYPSAWEGIMQANTVAGSISVEGKDIEILKDGRKDWVRREVVARKPKGEDIKASEVMIGSMTGSVKFSV